LPPYPRACRLASANRPWRDARKSRFRPGVHRAKSLCRHRSRHGSASGPLSENPGKEMGMANSNRQPTNHQRVAAAASISLALAFNHGSPVSVFSPWRWCRQVSSIPATRPFWLVANRGRQYADRKSASSPDEMRYLPGHWRSDNPLFLPGIRRCLSFRDISSAVRRAKQHYAGAGCRLGRFVGETEITRDV